ncbi:hypothetical protein LIER_11075 [Lithospermum erythrorhizon]|uniref:MULE transposase domain-containing protein n=1 Tax=Lithospermum erythrorhizon TaxID=34254 RepID=A0AAV3PLL9_LITER
MGLKLGQHVSRWQAWRAKNTVLKAIYGDEEEQFKRLWNFCVQREGFKSGCRRIVGMDGCYLKTKRGGQLLVTVGIYPNNNIFPIAYGLVDVENKSSWEWFLNHLYEHIRYGVGDENGQNEWTFMSDK